MHEEEKLRAFCYTKQQLFEVMLHIEEDTLMHWLHPQDGRILLTLYRKDDTWWMKQSIELHLSYQSLKLAHAYTIAWDNEQALLYFTCWNQASLHYTFIELPKRGSITIGRRQGDIRCTHALLSALHARLWREGEEWIIEDLHSTNGVYVNRVRCQKQVLHLGDCVDMMGMQLLFGTDFLAVSHVSSLYIAKRLSPFHAKEELVLPALMPQPNVQVMRIYEHYEIQPITLKDPIALPQRQFQPLLYLIGPSLTMCFGSFASSLCMVYQALDNDHQLGTVFPSLFLSFTMLAGTLIWPLLTRRYEKRKEKETLQRRKYLYQTYLNEQKKAACALLAQKEQSLRQLYQPSDSGQPLWQLALPQDRLFLCLGIADCSIPAPFLTSEESMRLHMDECILLRDAFMRKPWLLKQIPIIRECPRLEVIEIMGAQDTLLNYAQYLLLHHVLLYPPQSALLVLALDDERRPFPHFLPHQFSESRYRFLCSDQKNLPDVLAHLKESKLPILMLSFLPVATTFFTRYGQELPMALCAFHPTDVPNIVLSLKDEQGQLGEQRLHWQREAQFSVLIQRLSNIAYESSANSFPKQLSFFAMFHYARPTQFHIAKHWFDINQEGTLCASLGVREDGTRMELDLHERVHGPHGIVAGMTGSGKSELLISMLLSLAIRYHPYDCAFVLLDYKGGGMAKALQRLPHTLGIITNLDGSLIERSLLSLQAELERRQRIFAQVMDEQNCESMNIDLYQKLFHTHRVTAKIPHLLIVADEFAELKQQEPQFMEQLIRMARIGRSLGIHLILATQKPSGVVDDQIWSNARFHICLKVADKADSLDMLKREEGAQIKTVGRFYLQVGYDEIFTQGQCAYAKAPYDPDDKGVGKVLLQEMKSDGSIRREWKRETTQTHEPSELDVLIHEINLLAEAHDIQPQCVWLPPLQAALKQSDLPIGAFALADDPWHQRQFPILLSAHPSNTLLLAQSWKESFAALKTWASAYLNRQVNLNMHIVLVDGTYDHALRQLELPCIYANVSVDEQEDVFFLMNKLTQVRAKRETSTQWLLVIHHVSALLEQYEQGEEWLLRLAKDQGGCGIHLLLTARSSSELTARLLRHFPEQFVFRLQDENEHRCLLGKERRLGNTPLQALWKQEDQVYVVQFAQAMRIVKSVSSAFRLTMPQLSKRLSYQCFYRDVTQFFIGISLSERTCLTIEPQGLWILCGNERHRHLRMWKQIVAQYHYPIRFLDSLVQAKQIGMEILSVSPSQLSIQFQDPLGLKAKEAGQVLWYGNDFAAYRYLWGYETMASMERVMKGQGLWLREEVIPFQPVSEL